MDPELNLEKNMIKQNSAVKEHHQKLQGDREATLEHSDAEGRWHFAK